MKKHYIFIDESGSSDTKTYKESPVFTVCAMVIGSNNRDKFEKDLELIKLKYFKSKNYIIHSVELKRHLKTQENLHNFAKDMKKFLKNHSFFILYVTTIKDKAFRLGWDKKKILNSSYRILIGNLVKFLIAKNLCGQINNEASSAEQDIILYQNFFHYHVNGIERLNISPIEVKKHLTSLSFVTKLNNDAEQQVVDLYGCCPKFQFLINKGILKEEKIDPVVKVVMDSLDKKLFKGGAKAKNKIKLYKEINPSVLIP